MKRKIIIGLCLGFLLVGCQVRQGERFPWVLTPLTEETETRPVRAAMLLPLSGKSASMGEAFRNSGMMALQEHPDSPLELLFFDTEGTADGTIRAWNEARHQAPDLIIGPIFAPEVQALKKESPHVPILSFTTNHALMERDVYSLGVLIPNQVNRLIQFMCAAGQKRLAVMGPEDKTGELTMNHLAETIQRCPGMTMDTVSLYAPDTTNFNTAVLKIVPTPIDSKKKTLTEEEQELLNTPMADRLNFDGVRLQQVTSLLAYYDVTPRVVPFYGLATWQSVQDKGLSGGYFTATPTTRSAQFNRRYQHIFGIKPPRLASLAYDAVSLAAVLAEHPPFDASLLTQESGFNGVNGRFRLQTDGLNERLLEIFQFQPNMKFKTISPTPDTFPDPDAVFWSPDPSTEEINDESESEPDNPEAVHEQAAP